MPRRFAAARSVLARLLPKQAMNSSFGIASISRALTPSTTVVTTARTRGPTFSMKACRSGASHTLCTMYSRSSRSRARGHRFVG